MKQAAFSEMKFSFEVRSKFYMDKTWKNTIDFCIEHDKFIPHHYQNEILNIASNYGVYRKLEMLKDFKGMKIYAKLPTYDFFSEWVSKRINYFYEVKNSETFEDSYEIPTFPNSFQKTCWNVSNFCPQINFYDFWESLKKGIRMSEKKCTINLNSFCSSSVRVYNELYQ